MITVYTIGHGARTADEFRTVLNTHDIDCVIDVRAFPGSRRHPHFARAALERSLHETGIEYRWEGKALGGMRQPRADSLNTALPQSVRGFADHMASPDFDAALTRVTILASTRRAAIMCAETLPSQCHRALISDALAMRAIAVEHLIDATAPQRHVVSAAAHLDQGTLVYSAERQQRLI